jgi:hypothetical protein
MAGKRRIYNFDEEPRIMEAVVPFVNGAANAGTVGLGTTSAVCRAYWRVPRSGVITDIAFVGEDGIVQHGTNFQTFTGLNLGTLGTGNTSVLVTTAHHNTTDINAAALNGGTDLTAKKPYSLELHATAANLIVAEGEILEITATAGGSGAIVDAACCMFKLRTLPHGLKGTATHVGGASTLAPSVIQVLNSASGEALLGFSATSEVQNCRLDWGDQVLIDPTTKCTFSCRLKVSAVSSVSRSVWGLASAFNATLDNIVSNCWFKLEGNSLAVVLEGDDGTTDTDDQATSPATTLTAATYYNFDIVLGGGTGTFFINGTQVGTVSVPLLSGSTLLQPLIATQKDSGSGAATITVDWVTVG